MRRELDGAPHACSAGAPNRSRSARPRPRPGAHERREERLADRVRRGVAVRNTGFAQVTSAGRIEDGQTFVDVRKDQFVAAEPVEKSGNDFRRDQNRGVSRLREAAAATSAGSGETGSRSAAGNAPSSDPGCGPIRSSRGRSDTEPPRSGTRGNYTLQRLARHKRAPGSSSYISRVSCQLCEVCRWPIFGGFADSVTIWVASARCPTWSRRLTTWSARTFKQTLYEASPFNAIRLETDRRTKPATTSPRTSTPGPRTPCANGSTRTCCRQDTARSLYIYEQEFEAEGTRYNRRGFFARVRLEPFGRRQGLCPRTNHVRTQGRPAQALPRRPGSTSRPSSACTRTREGEVVRVLDPFTLKNPPLVATDHLGVSTPALDDHRHARDQHRDRTHGAEAGLHCRWPPSLRDRREVPRGTEGRGRSRGQ